MKFSISRNQFLKSLQLVTGVVERRQTLPILSNVLIIIENNNIRLMGSDSEVQILSKSTAESVESQGEITVPARKLLDITRSLPEESFIDISVNNNKATLVSGKSRFTLTTLPASDFPNIEIEDSQETLRVSISQSALKNLIDQTAFAMAIQDVRYYLNGTLFEVSKEGLKLITTDGHRLAVASHEIDVNTESTNQNILPRKAVLELTRLLEESDDVIDIIFTDNLFSINTDTYNFTSKLVDGKFPEYNKVIPQKDEADKVVVGSRLELKQSFMRAAILSNEKYRGVRFNVEDNLLTITASNPDQEQAEEQVTVDYNGEKISDLGFNVSYLLDVVNVLDAGNIKMTVANANNSALLEEEEGGNALYVIMPMRL